MASTTAVVTGAGRGLGRAIAERLAARGHQVLVTDIDAAAAADAAAAIGEPAWAMTQDVRDPDSHRRVAAAATGRGPIAAWVNNAGVLSVGPAWTADDAEVRRDVEVNVLGVMWGCRAAVDAMAGTGGHIINIASMAALVPAPGMAVYGATKHAVLGYTLALAGELRGRSPEITVSAVCPDAIETDMVRNVEHEQASSILFSARHLLTVDTVADQAVALLDRPRLVVAVPPHRAAMAHALRPFPAVGLRLLEGFARLGDRHRRKRS
jgi:short-subunit dehydrogenase